MMHMLQYLYMTASNEDDMTAPAKIPVFFSYARADDDPDHDSAEKSLMRRLYNDLTAAGFDVWWDRVSLPSRGLEFTEEIARAIDACSRFVLITGAGSNTSPYVRREWSYAHARCMPINPVLRNGDYALIPSVIGGMNAVDMREDAKYSERLQDLIAHLKDEVLPAAKLLYVPDLPKNHLIREVPFKTACEAVCADAIKPTVVSAPARATAVYGLGGIGKTTFAAAVAHDCAVRSRYQDGVIWLEIGQKPSVQMRQADLGVALGAAREEFFGAGMDEHSAALRLSALMAGKRALIVLDDVWDKDVIKHFPVQNTSCRLLITTRSPRLADKVEGTDVQLRELSDDEGARLIMQIAGLDETQTAICKQIASFLGGHTLAIRLAADRLVKGYADDAPDLLRLLHKADEHNPFQHLKLEDDDKNENLELSLALSYTGLNDDLKRRFDALGIFALGSTFDRAAIAAIWGDDDADDARAPLATLLDAGLLDEADKRYSQHRLLYAYARALLIEAGKLAQTAQRHFSFYEGLYGYEHDHTDTDYLNTITIDLLNLTDALHWGFRDLAERAIDLLNALGNYFRLLQPYTIYRPLLQAGLTAATDISYPRGQAYTLRALGDLDRMEADYPAARAQYQAALALYQAIPDRRGQANTLQGLGDLDSMEDDYPSARGRYDHAERLYNQIGDTVGKMNVLISNARLARAQGDLPTAEDYFQRLFELTDHHPAFRDHPMTKSLHQEYDQLFGSDTSSSDGDEMKQVMQALAQLYALGGADAVREALQDQVPQEQIDALIAMLRAQADAD